MNICERVDNRQSETEKKEPLCYITLNNNELDLDIDNSHSEAVAKLINEYRPITLKETKVQIKIILKDDKYINVHEDYHD